MDEKFDNKEEPIVVEGVDVDVSSFGFHKIKETDEVKFDNQRDYYVSLLYGTSEYYDVMINDPNLSDEARQKLEELKQEKIGLIVNELTNQLYMDFNDLMDILVNPDALVEEKEVAFSNAQEIINICRNELHDDKMATEFENRVTTLQDAINSMSKVKNVVDDNNEAISEQVDFASMTNNELYQYLFDLEDKIKDAAKRNTSDIPNDEIHALLNEGERLQAEIDKRINGITTKTEENVVSEPEVQNESSLESELDDFAKEQEQIISSKHFTMESKREMLDDLYNEREEVVNEANKSGRRR